MMAAEGLLPKKVFSFFYSRIIGETAELVFGGINSDRYTGQLLYYKVSEEFFWTIKGKILVRDLVQLFS
jgi:hypothetical protein